MRDEFLGDALGPYLLGRLAEGERLGLGEEVGHEQVVLADESGQQVVDGAGEADEVGGDDLGALVDQLVVGVLPVGPGVPQTTGPVCQSTRLPSRSTDLPLDSMSSCWR